jgi:hypothetical protein
VITVKPLLPDLKLHPIPESEVHSFTAQQVSAPCTAQQAPIPIKTLATATAVQVHAQPEPMLGSAAATCQEETKPMVKQASSVHQASDSAADGCLPTPEMPYQQAGEVTVARQPYTFSTQRCKLLSKLQRLGGKMFCWRESFMAGCFNLKVAA